MFGFDLAIPGVRITLWLAALIIIGAGFLSAKSMKMGLSVRNGLGGDLRNAIARSDSTGSRANHPTSGTWTAPFGGGADQAAAATRPVAPEPMAPESVALESVAPEPVAPEPVAGEPSADKEDA